MKNKILCNLIFTLLIWSIMLLIKHLYDMGNLEINLSISTIIGISVNLYCIFSSISLEKKVLTPYTIFQMLSIPFLYGQLFCREVLNLEISEMFDLSILVNREDMLDACFLIIYSQLALHFGLVIYKLLNKNTNEEHRDNSETELELKTLRTLGFIFLAVSIIPALYDFYINLTAARDLGYAGLSENNVYGLQSIVDKIIPFFQIALLCLMVGYKNKGSISKYFLLFMVLFYGVQMFFGNRGKPLIYVLVAIWLYHIAIKPINKKIIIITLICIIPVSSILNVIRQVRDDYGIDEWISNAGEMMIDNLTTSNPVLETVYEMGTAIYPISYTIDAIPETVDYKYGETYLLSIYSIVGITFSNEQNSLAYDMNIAAQISEMAGSPFGGAYIQEAYANFGWLSPIFMIFLGMAFEILNRKTLTAKTLISLVLMAYFLGSLLWTIRNVMVTLPREIVWYIIPTYILYKLIYNGKKKEELGELIR